MSPLHHIAAALRNVGTLPHFMDPAEIVVQIINRERYKLVVALTAEEQTLFFLKSLTADTDELRKLIGDMIPAAERRVAELQKDIDEMGLAGVMVEDGRLRLLPPTLEPPTGERLLGTNAGLANATRMVEEQEAAERLARS